MLALQRGEHFAEDTDMLGSGSKLWASLQHGFQAGLIVLDELVGVAGEPSGDLSDGRWRRCDGAWPGAVLSR
ncbi:hypothetical protein ACFU44_17350 [Nocardia rhizosphaerihabitans]|uniref:hypothetical protein n=1 Tax=Nocardia rhizosphaerihabitans TaxID=1691570 RepID=UPI00366A8F73